MYPKPTPKCNSRLSDLDDQDYEVSKERNPSTGAKEEIIRFKDGSSIRRGGGPAGPMNYNQYGEEC